MGTDLTRIVAALAELGDGELGALIDATTMRRRLRRALLAWVESVCDWELNRRHGFDFPLQPPEAAISPEEDSVSIDAASIIRAWFAQDGRQETRAVAALFDAIVGLLTGSECRH
jgi:hypothetical protein